MAPDAEKTGEHTAAKRIAEVLPDAGIYASMTVGTSMYPMLRQQRDTVVIVPVDGRAKKYDVVLFRRGDQNVLHRVIRVLPDGYLIRGDNCDAEESVSEEQILGVLAAFVRNGKHRKSTDLSCRIYAHLIVWLHPLFRAAVRTVRKLRK